MCGIVGVFGVPDKKNTKMFCDMLQMDVLRGWDSTGVLTVREDGDYFWMKDTGVPQILMRDPDFKSKITSAMVEDKHRLLLGHNRMATRGVVSADNAHPFDHDGIVMVHNGTIYSKFEIERNSGKVFQTDSEAICWSISAVGIEETYKKIDGAAVLVWWDDREKRLNILSNGKRTFQYGYSDDRKQLIFASEAWMIRSAAARHAVSIEKGKLFTLEDHHLWQFRMSRRGKVVGEVKKLDPFVRPVFNKDVNLLDQEDYGLAWEEYLGVPAEPRNAADRMLRGSQLAQRNPWLGRVVAAVNDRGQKTLPFSVDTRNTTTNGIGHNGGPPIIDEVGDQDNDNFTGPDWSVLRAKRMDEITFHNIYKKCHFCDASLEHEFEEAVILDDRAAACENCQMIAELNNLNLVHAR